MYRSLSPGAIGVDRRSINIFQAARDADFQGLEPDLTPLLEGQPAGEFRRAFDENGLRISGWGLPLNPLTSEDAFRQGLESLEIVAKAAASVGADRCSTWIPSYSEDRPFEDNFRFHIERLRPVAEVLGKHGCRFGLEFIGPKTFRAGKRYEFIHDMHGMLALCRDIGTGNMGLLLDSWHWYTSHGTIEDLLLLKDEDIVQVHVNDAPSGVPVDEQVDSRRKLMGETGVINMRGFLRSLGKIGYSGPVTPEPFSERLAAMEPGAAVAAAGEALKMVWGQSLG